MLRVVSKGFTVLKSLVALSIGVGLSLTGSAGAQEHNFPAMNSFGRFFGIGWSRGYHAGNLDGRFQAVKDRHPANTYGSHALLYPYQPAYEPQRAYASFNQGYAQPSRNIGGDSQPLHSIPQSVSSQANPTPAPPIPPKPLDPPPTWLRPFLKEDVATPEFGSKGTREDMEATEASPSDLIRPKTSNQAEPPNQEKPKPSDDDDLLTLSPPLQHVFEARRNQGSNR